MVRETLQAYCERTENHALLAQWDSLRNGALSPQHITYGSKQKVWWRCSRGHFWQTSVYVRTTGGAGCPYCAGKLPWPGESDLATRAPQLAREWHPTRNGALTPAQVLPGSHRAVWWQCERGHVWRSQIKSRVAGCGCPYCAGRQLISGETDLATADPLLAAQWHSEKNAPLTPKDVSPGTNKRVWWRCEKGHEWKAAVRSRSGGGCGCPVCAGRKILPGYNDFASAFPQLAAQWDSEKNGALRPEQLSCYSNRAVWWRCALGHSYRAAVGSRTARKKGCPYCAGQRVLPGFNDLATRAPEIAAQWHPSLNEQMTPQQFTAGSHYSAWWICGEGHVWKAAIYSRAGPQKCGCPVCAGKTARRSRAAIPATGSPGASPQSPPIIQFAEIAL